MTVHVPLRGAAAAARRTASSGSCPALRLELVTTLMRSLPKELRTRARAGARRRPRACSRRCEPRREPLLDALAARDRARRAACASRRGVGPRSAAAAPAHDVPRRGRRAAACSPRATTSTRCATRRARGCAPSWPRDRARLERSGLTSVDDRHAAARRSRCRAPAPPCAPTRRWSTRATTVGVRVARDARPRRRAAMRAGTRRLLLLTVAARPRAACSAGSATRRSSRWSTAPHGSVAAVLDDATAAAVDALIAEAGGPAWDEAGFARLRDHVAGALAERTLGDRARAGGGDPRRRARRAAALEQLPRPPRSRRRAPTSRASSAGSSTRASSPRRAPRGLRDVERYLRAAERRLERLPDTLAVDRDRMRAVHELEAELPQRSTRRGAGGPRCARSAGCSRSCASATSPRRSARAARCRASASAARWRTPRRAPRIPAPMPRLPDDFVWGTATASYQIEGAVHEDGRVAVDLGHVLAHARRDRSTATPATSPATTTTAGARTSTSLARPGRDRVPLLARLAAAAARRARAAQRRGLDFYERLVDALLERGITPWATLYHWDLPQTLEDAGGWPARDTAERFADYARGRARAPRRPHRRLDDAQRALVLGDARLRRRAATLRGARSRRAALRAAHHLLLGHGLARRGDARPGPHGQPPRDRPEPVAGVAGERPPEDADIARRVDGLLNRLYLDPLLLGRYPADVLDDVAAVTGAEYVRPGDEPAIAAPLDFLGINYYTRHVVRTGARSEEPTPWIGAEAVEFVGRGLPRTEMGWEIDASGLYDVLTRLAREYPPVPLYVTENGAAFDDAPAADGSVERSPAGRVPRRPLPRRRGRDRGRRRPARLLRVVADGQLRMGVRLQQAVRPRARRLRDAAPNPQGQCALVRGGDPPRRPGRLVLLA